MQRRLPAGGADAARGARRGRVRRRPRPPRARGDRPHQRHDGGAQADRADVRQLAVERPWLGGGPGPGPAGALAVPAAAQSMSAACRSSCAARSTRRPPACSERFDVDRALEELRRRRRVVSLVPTTLARLLDAGWREPPALRTVLLGGAAIPPALLERAAQAGVPVTPTYGMTEACSQIATAGTPLFCTRVTIAHDGEIVVGGPTVSPRPGRRAAHRRPGGAGRARPSAHHRAQGRHDHQRRRERRPDRGRGRVGRAPGRRRGGRPRAARCAVGRGRRRHRRPARGGARRPSCAPSPPRAWPPSRCQRRSPSPTRCRAPPRASSCAAAL